ncbi:hypothetical protein K2X33_06170 [bacterium]|nr:hypothetical protein [bacterium]
MKKLSLVSFLVLAITVGSLTSCSSKENRAADTAISGSADSANLGGASSGQGR